MRRHSRMHGLAAIVCGMVLVIAGTPGLRAQKFQDLFGSNGYSDRGAGGAQIASNGDYVVAGTTWGPSGGTSSDIYVVRTNASGIRIWDRVYDIAPGMNDVANDIYCCSNGDFVITGATQTSPGGPSDLVVLRINSFGTMLWCHRYGGALTDEMGYDIVEAKTGNGSTTKVGDLLVAGTSYTGLSTGNDGYLLRIPSTGGAPIWAATYDISSHQNSLYGIDEAIVGVVPGSTGDVVAVGVDYGNAVGDVWILRVDGSTGNVGFSPQGSAIYGTATGEDQGRRIQELRSSTYSGDLVITGRTNSGHSSDEILVLETQSDPLNFRASIHTGDAGANLDEGMALCEVTSSNIGLTHVGNILVTGRTDLGAFGSSDIFLAELHPGTLTLVTPPEIYGGNDRDIGLSVAQAPFNTLPSKPGYVVVGICGSPSLIPAGDVDQIYVIKTDVNLASCNSVSGVFNSSFPSWSPTASSITKVAATTNTPSSSSATTPNWGTQLCYFAKPVTPGGEEKPTLTLCGDHANPISRPSPMKHGGILQLQCAPSESRTAQVQVSDITGRVVFDGIHDFAPNAAPMRIETEGWSAGVYFVTITAGQSVERSTVVVVD